MEKPRKALKRSQKMVTRSSGVAGAMNTPEVRFWRDPEFDVLEVRYSRYREVAFSKHAHETYSIGVVESGATRMWARGVEHTVLAGEIVLFAPGEIHACNPIDAGWAYHMYHISADWVDDLARQINGDEDICVRFTNIIVRDEELALLYGELAALVDGKAELLERQSALTEAVAFTLQRHASVVCAVGTGAEREAVRRGRTHLAANVGAKVTLDELAQVAGLSPYHFLRVFKKATGMTPHAWQVQRRISLGRKLLRQGMSIAEAAQATGFTDQSHFGRQFRKHVGTTPRQYYSGGESNIPQDLHAPRE